MKRAPMALLCLLSFLFLLSSAPALAQQDFGEVAFANSGPPAAQADFLRGLRVNDTVVRPAQKAVSNGKDASAQDIPAA